MSLLSSLISFNKAKRFSGFFIETFFLPSPLADFGCDLCTSTFYYGFAINNILIYMFYYYNENFNHYSILIYKLSLSQYSLYIYLSYSINLDILIFIFYYITLFTYIYCLTCLLFLLIKIPQLTSLRY
jgi:hypothetical protein